METDSSICFICQVKNTDKVRSTDDGYINLADRQPKFKEARGAELLHLSRIDDGTGILNILRKKQCCLP